jgi:hypothetical protein
MKLATMEKPRVTILMRKAPRITLIGIQAGGKPIWATRINALVQLNKATHIVAE